MASTATNKQPLLVDRVLHQSVLLDGSTGSTTTDLGSAGVNGSLLVDCKNNDGALVEDVYAISRGKNYTINLYLSNYNDLLRPSSAEAGVRTRYIGKIDGNDNMDTVTNFKAPYVLAPTATIVQVNDETRLRALYVPKGLALWASIRRDAVKPVTDGPIVGAQGGYY